MPGIMHPRIKQSIFITSYVKFFLFLILKSIQCYCIIPASEHTQHAYIRFRQYSV